MWIPRFATNENGEDIKYVKDIEDVEAGWTIPELFAYRQANTMAPDFLLTGVWVEKDVNTNVNTTVTQMNQEESIYGFIKNTIAVSSDQTNQNAIQAYIQNLVGADASVRPQITDPTNPNRIILKIINQNNQEPIKARGVYNKNTGLIEIRVTYSRYGIEKILYENATELQMIKNANNNGVTSTTEGMELEEGERTVTIIDKKGNTKILNMEVIYPRTLTFNANGGTVTPEYITNYYGTSITMPTPTMSGYTITFNTNGGPSYANKTVTKTFAGWYTELPGGERKNYTTMPKENETLYAHWNEANYKLPTPTKTGYTFAGWYEDSGLTKKVGNGGDSYIPEKNVTLYAKWVAVYAKLYTDGLLDIRSTDITLSGKTLQSNFGNIAGGRSISAYYATYVKTVNIATKVEPISTAYWFDDYTNLTTINNIKNLDTSNVTNMRNMFDHCSSLTSLNLSGFDTSNVTNMGYMFSYCSGLTNLNLSNFNTSNVTIMYDMFEHCSSLTNINLSSFNTSKVTYMISMFSYCSSLTNLNLSNFDTSNVIEMHYMFQNCSSLTSLNLSSFNTNKVTSMQQMFLNCSNLTLLDVSSFNTSNVTNMVNMFSTCSSLTSLDLSNFDTRNVTTMNQMFINCKNLKEIYVGENWVTTNATTTKMFTGCGTSSVTPKE